MNYYIQGSPARAKEIKAAFEAKGCTLYRLISQCNSEDLIYYSLNGRVRCIKKDNLYLFEAHPGYTKLELPVKSKFKVGDCIVNDYCAGKVIALTDDAYLLDSGQGIPFSCEHNAHLWTIADAKDGDVLALNGKPFIYSHKYGKNYCYIDDCGQFRMNFNLVLEGNCVCPATKQERDLLFSKMRKVGYEWDEKKKELRKIIEPNFKVGDWVVTDYGKVSQVVSVDKDGDGYTLDDGVYFSGSWCDMYHHWTIQDVKDGDVLVTTKIRSCPYIYRKTCYDDGYAYYYVGIDGGGDLSIAYPRIREPYLGLIEDSIPATKEQRDLLFAKMQEAGYTWDAEKKELRKIKPHYDISNFKPFDKVLIRFGNNDTWRADFFSHIKEDRGRYFVGIGYANKQCIPFEGNEHLLGTTDMCDERFINW